MAFVLLSRSRSKPQGSVKPVPKQKSAGVQRPADSPEAAKVTGQSTNIAWDFSKIQIFPPDQATRPQAASALSTLPLLGSIQRKLVVGEVNDPLEHEADRVADRVMHMADGAVPATPAAAGLRRKCTACGAATASVPALRLAPVGVHATLGSAGHALDAQTRGFFEPRLGLDLGVVRIHHDRGAATSARAVAARAYTVGSDIVFGAGEYRPSTSEGRALLAHELAHVRQDALGGCPGVQLRRTPCPSCHKPVGTQQVTLEKLHDDDVYYLPDDDASEFFTYMRAGLYWGEY
jgi:hypothetical protein